MPGLHMAKPKSNGPKKSKGKPKAKAGKVEDGHKATKTMSRHGSKDPKIDAKIEEEAKGFKKKLKTHQRTGAFTPSTMQKKRAIPIKRTWRPLAAGGLLIGIAIIGLITSGNLVLTANNNPLYSPATGSLKGFVVNEDGEVLVGAIVVIDGDRMVEHTNSNGRYKFTGVPKGERVLKASFPGYTTVRFPTMVLGGTELSGIGDTNLSMKKATVTNIDMTTGTAMVKGHVYDNVQNPEVGATVTNSVSGNKVLTDINGQFDLGNLTIGTAEISVQQDDFKVTIVRFYVYPERDDLNVNLSPGNGTLVMDLKVGNVTITGSVKDMGGIPVMGALVATNGSATETGTDGSFIILSRTGEVSVTATALDMSSTTMRFYVDQSGTDISLTIGPEKPNDQKGDREALKSNLSVCGVVILFMSIFIIATGVVTMQRRRFWMAIGGSLFGSVFMLMTFQYGVVLGLISFGLLLFSRREFE